MEKIAVGMSGGVDSTVTAILLKQMGYEVIGVTMCVYGAGKAEDTEICKEASAVCEMLNIEHHVLDVRELFKEKVIDNFTDEYEQARTPNPCLRCNRYIKWGAILDFCDQNNIEKMATGHYACIEELPNGRVSVKKSDYDNKDQSYVLYSLTQEQLRRTLMPLGKYEKKEVREIAQKAGLSVASKPDSEDICFIPDNDYSAFITSVTNKKYSPGNFVDMNGNILGKHKGIINYTVGQRKGLGIALGKPVFVSKILPKTNEVVLSDNEELFKKVVYGKEINYMGIEKFNKTRCIGKIRYAHKGAECTATEMEDGKLIIEFDEPQRAPAPGQAIVLYENDMVLGGAIIMSD